MKPLQNIALACKQSENYQVEDEPAECGLEYWVIDIRGSQLWVHRNPHYGEYQSIATYSIGIIKPLALSD
ncbi:MAG: hypothetical protein F6K24_58185, partial [Okeania sp. SIO2D1]|nr:hypothetical protein [Okeania sp. SIO2D1]